MPKPYRLLAIAIVLVAATAVLVAAYFYPRLNKPQSVLGIQACESYTYTDWSACLNGRQSRQVLTSLPNNCGQGTPVTEQVCHVCTNFTYSDWSECIDGRQIRSVATTTPPGCTGGIPDLSRSCNPGSLVALNELSLTTNGQTSIKLGASEQDLASLGAQGYKLEAQLGYVYSQPGPDTKAVYDMFNSRTNSEIYTGDEANKDALISKGYDLAAVIGYIYNNSGINSVALYRLAAANGTNYYTTSEQVKATMQGYGYQLQETVGFVSTTK